ncbi:hypothetical protein LDC_1425 [sediment metagenome]|uniref:Uncharacterized protein n=1 Tax=sediment metagenome TaxID=749907 RepID=D9PIR7_9ZZZZ
MTTPIDPELARTLQAAGISPGAYARFAEAERAAVRDEHATREQRRNTRAEASAALVGRSGTVPERLDDIAAAHYREARAA